MFIFRYVYNGIFSTKFSRNFKIWFENKSIGLQFEPKAFRAI